MADGMLKLIQAGTEALEKSGKQWDLHPSIAAAVIIEAVQPLIQAEVFGDFREKVRELQGAAYVSWRAAVPGDIASAAEAGGECVAYSRVLDLIDGAEDG